MCPPAALRQLDVRLAQNIVIETRKNLLRKLEFVWLGNSGYKLTTGDRPANTDRIKKDKAELGQYSAKAGKARTAYRIKSRKKDYILWKQCVRRIEAVASQRHKTGTQKGQGPRDYEVEWEGYKERKREELQRRVADALYKENDGTTRIVRQDGSYGYIYH
ncbi:hypothetical protein DFH09DRAFT_1082334 [Mycena vulgaris]|nr:hypothetical protein DFH09DRAFT_1082334 [Mycena vulgaris]